MCVSVFLSIWKEKNDNEQWTNEQMLEWTNEQMSEWTNEQMSEWINEPMNNVSLIDDTMSKSYSDSDCDLMIESISVNDIYSISSTSCHISCCFFQK